MRKLVVAMLVAACVAPTSHSGTQVRLLANGGELIGLGGTGLPTLSDAQMTTVEDVLRSDPFNYDFSSSYALTTPESIYPGTYQDDEIDLLNYLHQAAANGQDTVTVFGVSQSAGVISMTIQDLQNGTWQGLTPSGWGQGGLVDYGSNALPSAIHWVALAPPDMPVHGNASGMAYNPGMHGLFQSLYPNVTGDSSGSESYANQFVSNANIPGVNSDITVYCGEYDPICDMASGSNFYSSVNNWAGLSDIHGNYASLPDSTLEWEMQNAVPLNDVNGADGTAYNLMPDVYNFGTSANPDYDSLLPYLYGDLWDQSYYEEQLPYYSMLVDAGYSDADHPFDYYIDGQEYTFTPADGGFELVKVGDGIAPLDLSTLTPDQLNVAESLALSISQGTISPTDVMDSPFTDPSWLVEIMNWFSAL